MANVIPQSVELEGTARTFDDATRLAVEQRIERVVRGVTSAHGAGFRLTYTHGYAPVVNEATLTGQVRAALEATFGAEPVVPAEPIMASDDFSAYGAAAPSAFFFIGARNTRIGADQPHHHPAFAIDESALTIGTAALAQAALSLCSDTG